MRIEVKLVDMTALHGRRDFDRTRGNNSLCFAGPWRGGGILLGGGAAGAVDAVSCDDFGKLRACTATLKIAADFATTTPHVDNCPGKP